MDIQGGVDAQDERDAMAFQPLYTAVATAHGGRTGRVRSDDGLIDMPLAMPTSLGGPGWRGHQP